MVHATLTGVSAVYGPSGERVGSWLGTGASTTRVYDVPLAHGITPYVRYGDWPVQGSLLILALVCAGEGCGRSGCGGPLRDLSYHPLAQLMSRQRVPGAEHLSGAYGVEEGEDDLLDAALPGHRHPVPLRRRTVGWPLWSTTSARLRTWRLVSWPETSRISSTEPLSRFITPSAVKPSPESWSTRWCSRPSWVRARTVTSSTGPGTRNRRVSTMG